MVVDTDIFVSARNRHEAGDEACRRLLDRIDEGALRALVSTITIAEVRAGLKPAESRNVGQAFVSHLLTSPNHRVEPVDVAIAEWAGDILESSRIALPDALIVATGRRRDAECVISQDERLARSRTMVRIRSPEESRKTTVDRRSSSPVRTFRYALPQRRSSSPGASEGPRGIERSPLPLSA